MKRLTKTMINRLKLQLRFAEDKEQDLKGMSQVFNLPVEELKKQLK